MPVNNFLNNINKYIDKWNTSNISKANANTGSNDPMYGLAPQTPSYTLPSAMDYINNLKVTRENMQSKNPVQVADKNNAIPIRTSTPTPTARATNKSNTPTNSYKGLTGFTPTKSTYGIPFNDYRSGDINIFDTPINSTSAYDSNGKSLLGTSSDISDILGKTGGGTEKGWFESMGGLEGAGSALSGLANLGSSIANIVIGTKNYGLAKDRFNFEKNAFNVNLANQSKLINNQINSATHAAAASYGLRNMTGDPDMQAKYDAYMEKAKNKHVSGYVG